MFKKTISLLTLLFVGFTLVAQTDSIPAPQGTPKLEKEKNNNWILIGLGVVSEVHYENDIDGILEFPNVGFDLYVSSKKEGDIIEPGLSLGWQPIGTTQEEYTVISNGDTTSGMLRASNQMVHVYYTPRVTILKNMPASIYIEGIVGMKGALLTYQRFDDEDELIEQDVHGFYGTWNLGYSLGLRWKIINKVALDIRYARVSSGDLERIDSFNSQGGHLNYTTTAWDAPVGYLRAGLNFIF